MYIRLSHFNVFDGNCWNVAVDKCFNIFDGIPFNKFGWISKIEKNKNLFTIQNCILKFMFVNFDKLNFRIMQQIKESKRKHF